MEFELAVAPEIKWTYRDVANWISELGFPQYQVRLCQIYIIQALTLMLLLANLTHKTIMQKTTWRMGTHLRLLSDNYPLNTNMPVFRWFSKIFAPLFFGRK